MASINRMRSSNSLWSVQLTSSITSHASRCRPNAHPLHWKREPLAPNTRSMAVDRLPFIRRDRYVAPYFVGYRQRAPAHLAPDATLIQRRMKFVSLVRPPTGETEQPRSCVPHATALPSPAGPGRKETSSWQPPTHHRPKLRIDRTPSVGHRTCFAFSA